MRSVDLGTVHDQAERVTGCLVTQLSGLGVDVTKALAALAVVRSSLLAGGILWPPLGWSSSADGWGGEAWSSDADPSLYLRIQV